MFQCTHQSQEAYQRNKKKEGKPESLVSLEKNKSSLEKGVTLIGPSPSFLGSWPLPNIEI
jgi:hypothetical protein